MQNSKINRNTNIDDINLTPEQESIFNEIENTKDHVFVTGKAGSGKSMLLQYFRKNTGKKTLVCAYTGVAAINIGGQTINSLFQIPPERIILDKLNLNERARKLLSKIDTLVIDEISMVRVDYMEAIDILLREAKGKSIPFGGVQIVMFGDLYQLPPIVERELISYFEDSNGGIYFFNANAWKNSEIKIYELTEIFRQSNDLTFLNILNDLRCGRVDEEHLNILNERIGCEPADNSIALTSTRNLSNIINKRNLGEIDKKIYKYNARVKGQISESWHPTDEELGIKEGAQVMLIKNDPKGRWVNGTIAIVKSLNEDEIIIDIDGEEHHIHHETWEKIQYKYNKDTKEIEEEVIASFTQYPLCLAWAITIHKSQGKTLESIVIDMGRGAFAHGQTYVALSRCTKLEGIYLNREISKNDIIVDPAIVKFMEGAEVIRIGEE